LSVKDILLAISIIATWAFNFIAAKYAMQHFPPFFVSGLRFTVVALVLIWFFRPPIGFFKRIFFLTITLGILHFALILVGLSGLDASTTTIAAQSGVPFSIILAWLIFKERLHKFQIMGVCVAFAGLILLIGEPQILNNISFFLIAIFAMFFWALANIQSRGLKDINPFMLNAWFSLIVAPELFLISYFTEDNQWELLFTVPWEAVLGILYMSVFSTIFAYSMWYRLLGKYTISQVAPFNLLSPVFGMLFGSFILGETVGLYKIFGAMVTISGVALLILIKPRKT
jgi:O-acetylserine/cysteine efflux transporter